MMDQRINEMMFVLLRSAICGESLLTRQYEELNEETLEKLYILSKKHDMAHLAAVGLEANPSINPTGKYAQSFVKEMLKAVYRYEQIHHELIVLCEALESAGIDFIPLKGSVIRKYYPEPWMRTSCDIDVLVHEADLDAAVAYLTTSLAYVDQGKGPHDISLYTPNGVHIELHYALVEEGSAVAASEILREIWNFATPSADNRHFFELSDEMFYFYHIAHMAKHFEGGGCGIKPFMDLWILDRLENADISKRDALLERGGLLRFCSVARRLSKVWFEKAEHDELTLQMEQYILHGGVYGSTENRVIVQQQKKGGRMRYLLSRIFLPYDVIKFHYPILQKHRWLTPIMEVRRWFRLLFCGHAKRVTREIKYNSGVSEIKAAETRKFLDDLGL